MRKNRKNYILTEFRIASIEVGTQLKLSDLDEKLDKDDDSL